MNSETHFIFAQAARGIIGITGTALGAIMPWQEHLQWGLAMVASVVGIMVGIASLYTIIRAWRDKK